MSYWMVRLEVFAFDTEAEAKAYKDALIDAFCAMPESEEYASSAALVFCEDDDAP